MFVRISFTAEKVAGMKSKVPRDPLSRESFNSGTATPDVIFCKRVTISFETKHKMQQDAGEQIRLGSRGLARCDRGPCGATDRP